MAVSTVDIYPSGPLIAMLGNPNAGKTSLFNILTGSKQKVANYAGVTVERVEGQLIGAPEKIRVLDLHLFLSSALARREGDGRRPQGRRARRAQARPRRLRA